MIDNALTAFGNFAELLAGRSVALFLDYDGTLTPIVDRPELAIMSERARAVLAKLAETVPTTIVSGRGRTDVSNLVKLPGLTYAGSHGFDIEMPDKRVVHPMNIGSLDRDLQSAKAELEIELANFAGAFVEDKRFSLAVHYRLVSPDYVPAVEAVVARVAALYPDLRRTGGKMVFELRPALPWDKGRAVLWILNQQGLDFGDVLPIYIGDDETDRDAFAALRELGVGIFVGPPEEAGDAKFWLEDTEAVHAFLEELCKLAPEVTDCDMFSHRCWWSS